MNETCYSDKDMGRGFYKVKFFVNASHAHLTRSFDSPYLAKQFVEKLRHSKRCTLISYPSFN